MATYAWDFGFDWNASLDPSLGNGKYYLQNGFVNMASRGPGKPVNLQQGDTIRFTIYDVTPGAAGLSQYKIASGQISFNKAEASQQDKSPFVEPSFVTTTGSSTISGTSVIFGPWPAWDQTPPQVISVSSGRYLMSAVLNVTDGTTTKTYSVDPEMIIGSAG